MTSNTTAESLSLQDRSIYRELFLLADTERKSFLLKNEAMAFFSKTGIPEALLQEIWETADQEQKDYITELEFYIALKLIACAQNGTEASSDILSTQVPAPQFKGVSIQSRPTLEIAPMTSNEREAYINIFQSCHPVDGLLHGEQAIEIFNRSRLPTDKLAQVWELADTRNSGTLNKTEFIIAMHYISRLMKDPSLVLPTTLPSRVYAEATGKFASSIRRYNTVVSSPVVRHSRASSNASLSYASPLMSQAVAASTSTLSLTDSSISSHSPITVLPEEKERYRGYFEQLDSDNSGYIDSDEAVYFFSHSQLPNSELATIWEIADSRRLGKLDLHDFCVAMHLINMRKRGESIERYEAMLGNSIALSPVMQQQNNSLSTVSQYELDQRYELENQLIEVKQQMSYEQKRIQDYEVKKSEQQQQIAQLEQEMSRVKNELEAAKASAEEAERVLALEQKRNSELLNETSSLPSASSVPELTRTSSVLSGSTAMSPLSDYNQTVPSTTTLFDPFAGFKKMNGSSTQSKLPLSPVQSKAISKYGFDITAFDALSVTAENAVDSNAQPSVKDDLASLFVSSSSAVGEKKPTPNSFDSIFL